MIEWIAVVDKPPPIGEWVLTSKSGSDWPIMETNALRYGSGKFKDPSLLYWDCGSDFEDVTHWAKLPEIPKTK